MSDSSEHSTGLLTHRQIFFFWLPLMVSMLMMTIEGPWVQGGISRKPDAQLQLAAFGLVLSLSVTIEAPIIMLLATGNALARDRQAYRVLWRFMMALNLLLTVLALLMAFTPLLDLYLGGLLGIPAPIIEATRPGMAIMVLWTALIGYRRFHQGVMIRSGHTRAVGIGTVIRIATSGGVAILLGLFTDIPGAQIGAWSLIMAVVVEALYTWRASQPDVQTVVATDPSPSRKPLTYRAVMRFHLPLALTSILTLLVRPLIESGLASTPDAKEALAAWPVIFSIFLIMRAAAFAWQEAVIALSKNAHSLHMIRRFTQGMTLILTGLMVLVAFTPLIDLYIGQILSIPEAIRPEVVAGTRAGLLIPAFSVLQSYLRGLLMLADHTAPIYQAMGPGFVLTGVVMWIGIQIVPAGVVVASLAMTAGITVELLYLWRAYTQQSGNLRQILLREAAGD